MSITFLSALPLIAVPLVLHLFDRRRRTIIDWGAMQFLREATVHGSRRRKLRQWLLLCTRMTALLLLVLALAQPVVPGRWWGGGSERELLIVLDNSLSMSREDRSTPLFDTWRDLHAKVKRSWPLRRVSGCR